MLKRKDFLNFIPQPTNADVILYDYDLKDLLDVDVLAEYKSEYKNYQKKRERFLILKESFERYKDYINSIYLFRKDWNEEDYLKALQNDKRTYSTLYSEIKKKETAISVLQQKSKSMQDRINIQIAKEEKDLELKKENIDQDIEVNKQKLEYYKNKLSDLKIDESSLQKRIKINEEEFKELQNMDSKLCKGAYKCDLCGHLIRSAGPESRIYTRLVKMLEINKQDLENLAQKKEKIDLDIANCENEIKKAKTNLQNSISFKRESGNFYRKKSIEVLKLEALQDDIINNISILENELKTNPQVREDEFLQLKNRINNCELSLENLKTIKKFKEEKKDEINEYNSLKLELKKIMEKLNKLKNFLKIYFKIYEQKGNEYCLNVIKFKIYNFDDYELKEIFEIYYKDTLYEELSKDLKDEVDKILIDKFQIYI